MIAKPKATISKFSGMSNDGGIFYLDGFSIEKNGVLSLDENYRITELKHSGDNGFSNMSSIMAMTSVYPLTGSTINSPTGYTLMMNNSGLFFIYDLLGSATQGKIGGTSSSGDYLYIQKPDLFVLPSGNFIYTSSRHLGLGIRGLCKSNSTTTTIVDKEGRNFATLGLSISAPNNKVTNLKTGKEYTITAIGNENATNDKLTFTAIDASPNNENDEFIALVNTKWDLNDTVTVPNFTGQPSQVYWSRPIKQYGNQYLIGSGNYLALLATDENTIDQSYKQLPTGYQLVAFEVAGTNILVSAYDSNGKGHLLLWDGYTEGWNEILNLETAPRALEPYGFGWVYLLDGIIYFTDGRSVQKLISSTLFSSSNYNSSNFNAIATLNDNIYFGVGSASVGDTKNRGVLVFNPQWGLSFFKCLRNGSNSVVPYCLEIKSGANISSIYSTQPRLEIAGDRFYQYMSEYAPNSNSKFFRSVVFLLDFGQETQVNEIWLDIKRGGKYPLTNRSQKNSILSVNYGDNKIPIVGYGQIGEATSTTAMTNPNGVAYPGVVGQEIEFLEESAISGQRTFIQSIANPGTANETWVVSPAVSETVGPTNLRAWGLKSGETKSITLEDLSKPIRFNVNFLGDKMWLEVVVRGTTDPFPVSINQIMLF